MRVLWVTIFHLNSSNIVTLKKLVNTPWLCFRWGQVYWTLDLKCPPHTPQLSVWAPQRHATPLPCPISTLIPWKSNPLNSIHHEGQFALLLPQWAEITIASHWTDECTTAYMNQCFGKRWSWSFGSLFGSSPTVWWLTSSYLNPAQLIKSRGEWY